LQTVTAKFVATLAVDNDLAQLAALRRWLVNWAWLLGGSLLLLFTLGAPLWMSFFQTTSVWPFILLGIGLPVYLVQGVERGVLQGQTRFGRLALSYQAEMWTRLACAVTLVAIGWAVAGAVVGLTLSFVATWLVARRARLGLPSATRLDPARRTQVLKFVGPVSASLIGQVIISNSDILIVKHFFEAAEAGHYAALALIGRIVFFATWSVVTMLIPLVAQKAHKGESHRQYLTLSLGLVGVISAIIMGVCFVMPNFIVEILFGKEYLSIAPLLWLYAAATAAYALGNVLVTYWLSAGKSGGSLLALLAGLAQVAGLWIFHASLLEVVLVQLYLMGALFGLLLIWDRWLAFAGLRKLKQQESIR
jgi:O-antigen/teichoic acid export membrane protein